MLTIGGHYNWKHAEKDKLIYLGKKGSWHQFKKIGDPREVWCEVMDSELHMIEETRENPGRVAHLTGLCAAAYQLAGLVGAPESWLDAFSDAANGSIGESFKGDPLDLLPILPDQLSGTQELQKRVAELPRPDLQTDPCNEAGMPTDYYTAGTVRRLLAATLAVPEPSPEQLKQILDGLDHCYAKESQAQFLKVWIRDWTAHQLAAAPQPAVPHPTITEDWLTKRNAVSPDEPSEFTARPAVAEPALFDREAFVAEALSKGATQKNAELVADSISPAAETSATASVDGLTIPRTLRQKTHSLFEAARCLGVAQEAHDVDAVKLWEPVAEALCRSIIDAEPAPLNVPSIDDVALLKAYSRAHNGQQLSGARRTQFLADARLGAEFVLAEVQKGGSHD